MVRLSRFGVFILVVFSGWAGPRVASPETARAALAQLPLRFEANQGQWRPAVRYAARAGGYTVALTERGASVILPEAGRLDLSLSGSNAAAAIEPLEPQITKTSYFHGSPDQWRGGIANYARVRYRGVYPGVDLVFYGNGNRLEYDFVLAPGADANAIRLRFDGAAGVRVTAEGDLALETGSGAIIQKKPAVYQGGKPVAGSYVLVARDEVALRLGRYDHSRPLTIDPVLVYSTYMGGAFADQIVAMKINAQGQLYVVGYTGDDLMGFSSGAYDIFNSGGSDVFVAIIDTTPAGGYSIPYLTYIGGTGNDFPTGLAVDSNGVVYVCGKTLSTDFPMAGNSAQTTGISGFFTGFVFQLNPSVSGTSALYYSTYLGGTSGLTSPNGIDLDAAGNMYIVGTTQAADFPVTASAYAGVMYGPQDAFLCELNPNTSDFLYSTFMGGELDDDGRAIAVTPDGIVYFAATTNSTLFPLAGNSWRTTLTGTGGYYDAVIGVMDMTKFGVDSLLYTSYFGGSDNEEVRAIALDAKGNLIVTGYTLSNDLPGITPDAVQPAYGGNGDVFVVTVNPNSPAFIVYCTYLGGSEGEVAYAVTPDSTGAIYLTGYTLSSDFPVRNATQPAWGNGIDVFVSKLRPSVAGNAGLEFSTYVGGATINQGTAITLGSNASVYVGGSTSGSFPTTDNAYQAGYGGGATDAFVLVLSQPGVTTGPVSHARHSQRAPRIRTR
jgi:hypothetical protein